jgi:hypothetical protein
MERNLGAWDILKYMREGATLRRRPTTSEVTLTLGDGQTYSVPIEVVDILVDQHKIIKEQDGGVFELTD